MGRIKTKEIMKINFAAVCLLAVAAAHPHKGKKGKGHFKKHEHPVIDYMVDTYREIENVIGDLVSDVPTVAAQWQADAVQDMEGNIPGVRPGKTPYHSFYDYPNRHRYQYETQDQVFDFTAGKVYKVKSNGNCCYADNVDPDTGSPKAMIEIAPVAKAKDEGAVADGEDWQQKVNLVVMKTTTDWVVTADNTIADWNQDIRVGKTGEQWMTVDVAYTNTQVGGLTDDDFLTSVTATCTSTCTFTDYQEMMIDSGLAYGEDSASESESEEEESLQGFDDDCSVPTGVEFGAACRMRELCGTGCAEGSCVWTWPSGSTMDDPATKCGCSQCIDTDIFLN